MCPPSGHVAGVIARCDTQEGVHKAPANEVITGAVGLIAQHERGSPRPAELRRRSTRVRALPGPRHSRVGRAHHQRRSRLALHQRAPPVHHAAPLARGGHAVVGVRAQRAAHLGAARRRVSTSSSRGCGPTAISPARRPRSRTSSSATRPPTRYEERQAGQLLIEVGVAPAIPTEYIIFNVVQKMSEHAVQAE